MNTFSRQAPIISVYHSPDTKTPITVVRVCYKGKVFIGTSTVHPEDLPFYSERVGTNIATYRARIKAIKYAVTTKQGEYNIKKTFLYEASGFDPAIMDIIDTTGRLNAHLNKLEHEINQLQKLLKQEKEALNIYLRDLKKAFNSVRKMREKDKTN